MADRPFSSPPPSSILVIGAGVFGLSTFHALLTSPRYAQTNLTLLDPYLPSLSDRDDEAGKNAWQNPHAASIDSSRIVRADYADPAYTELAAQAQEKWREGIGRRRRKVQANDKGSNVTVGGGEEDAGLEVDGHEEEEEEEEEEAGRVYHESGLLVTSTNSGSDYVDSACKNCEEVLGVKTIQLKGETDIRKAAGLPSTFETANGNIEGEESAVGDTGYLNRHSGWANASAAMASRMSQVLHLAKARNLHPHHQSSLSRSPSPITFVRGQAHRLLSLPSPNPHGRRVQCTGAALALAPAPHNGERSIEADLTILAAGAWSPLPPRPPRESRSEWASSRVRASHGAGSGGFEGDARAAESGNGDVCHTAHASRRRRGRRRGRGRGWEVKVARHGHGYANPVRVVVPHIPCGAGALGTTERGAEVTMVGIEASVPAATFSPIPPEGDIALRSFLRGLFPATSHPLIPSENSQPAHLPIRSRPWLQTRICWYADTPTGDFLVDFHPATQKSLMVAGGGSGHGFKFLPVLGEKVVQRIEGRLGDRLGERWRWREGVVGGDGGWKGDGSRGGKEGMVLSEEMEKGRWRSRDGKSKL
ncbi:uncharacterized protein KY384_000704 [Bacidia gigantensis]|uniref:uncharacterized protein n=1 Tax=Bacidia gigantensis TaxID=2732470 RepID=UPI001D04A7FF|nr:uncharacterized protein KY384_000704 [Bacidia gigantensis]KAG8525942.1 hypothetical protein KY384_000704 [Bacidia gigantensis]